MQAVSDASASGGKYIAPASSEAGKATYNLNIAAAGTYKIVARVYAPATSQDSFYFSVDGIQKDTWDLNPEVAQDKFNVWFDDDTAQRGAGTATVPEFDPYILELAAGSHSLTVYGREAGTRIDYLSIISACTHPADTDCDNCLTQDELYLSKWKSGQATLANTMEAI
jgi:hypothetical protein